MDQRIFLILGIQTKLSGGALLVPIIPLGDRVEVMLIPLILVPLLSLEDGVEVSPIPL